MHTRTLRQGLDVSAIGLGAMRNGTETAKREYFHVRHL